MQVAAPLDDLVYPERDALAAKPMPSATVVDGLPPELPDRHVSVDQLSTRRNHHGVGCVDAGAEVRITEQKTQVEHVVQGLNRGRRHQHSPNTRLGASLPGWGGSPRLEPEW